MYPFTATSQELRQVSEPYHQVVTFTDDERRMRSHNGIESRESDDFEQLGKEHSLPLHVQREFRFINQDDRIRLYSEEHVIVEYKLVLLAG